MREWMEMNHIQSVSVDIDDILQHDYSLAALSFFAESSSCSLCF